MKKLFAILATLMLCALALTGCSADELTSVTATQAPAAATQKPEEKPAEENGGDAEMPGTAETPEATAEAESENG